MGEWLREKHEGGNTKGRGKESQEQKRRGNDDKTRCGAGVDREGLDGATGEREEGRKRG